MTLFHWDHNTNNGAPDVHPSGFDGGRSEKSADQGRQQIFQPDAGLADPQLCSQQHPGQRGHRTRGDKGADHEFAGGDAVQLCGALVGADGLGVPVVRALNQVNTSLGFESGFIIVVVAIMLDRMLRVDRS